MTIKLPALFSDHAVLQRGMPVPVWGWAPPRVMMDVSLGAAAAATKSGPDGRFQVELPPLPAGGPYALRVSCPGEAVVVQDVYVGEVWLASGQSNMEWALNDCGLSSQEQAAADIPTLRMFTVDRTAMIGRRSDVKGGWQRATPKTALAFSAVGYYFAKRIGAELGVAVGILNSSWGGTVAEAWTSRETLARNPDYAPWMRRYHATINCREYWQGGDGQRANPWPADPGNQAAANGWAAGEFDDQGWPEMMLPSTWQAAGHNHSGIFWFRKSVDLPAEWAGRDIRLDIGAVDKQDITYFNGEKVGAMGTGFEQEFWNVNRSYVVPGRLVRAGHNVVAVRANSFVYAGGLIGPASEMELGLVNDAGPSVPLAGVWRYQVEHNFGLVVPPIAALGEGNANSPHMLFDNLIAPLLPYGIRGVIWYQGESNADAPDKYRQLIVEMIRGWRQAWGQGDFPFLQVQLANYMAPLPFQHNSDWALLREAQLQATREPGVGLAVAIDIGDANDIHPKNKRDVGHRLAQWALGQSYGRPIVPSGPLYSHMTIEGDRIRVHFDHAAQGLIAKGGDLKTFVCAGVGRRFVEAEAVIEGSTVVVRSATVPEPFAVRYAWANNPAGCNLYNTAGLPASPFRTDTWSPTQG